MMASSAVHYDPIDGVPSVAGREIIKMVSELSHGISNFAEFRSDIKVRSLLPPPSRYRLRIATSSQRHAPTPAAALTLVSNQAWGNDNINHTDRELIALKASKDRFQATFRA